MRICMYPDANLQAIKIAAERLALTGNKSAKRLLSSILLCEDQRRTDHNHRHRVRRMHLEDINRSALELKDEIDNHAWDCDTVANHTAKPFLDKIEA